MHEIEEPFAAPHRAYLNKVERTSIETYKRLLSFIIGDFGASLRSLQREKRLFHPLCTAAPHRDPELITRPDNPLNTLPDAMSIAVAKSVKIQSRGSDRPSTLELELNLVRESVTSQAMMTEEVYTACLHCVVVDLQNFSTARRPLERTVSVSAIKKKMRAPHGHNTFDSLTRDLHILYSGLCRRCLPGRSIAVSTTKKVLPFDFMVRFLRTEQVRYRDRSLPNTSS